MASGGRVFQHPAAALLGTYSGIPSSRLDKLLSPAEVTSQRVNHRCTLRIKVSRRERIEPHPQLGFHVEQTADFNAAKLRAFRPQRLDLSKATLQHLDFAFRQAVNVFAHRPAFVSLW